MLLSPLYLLFWFGTGKKSISSKFLFCRHESGSCVAQVLLLPAYPYHPSTTTPQHPRYLLFSLPLTRAMLSAHENRDDSDSEMSDDIFSTVDSKVKQLELAVQEFQKALEVTSLQPYFDGVILQLHNLSQETNKRLDEVSTFYAWLVRTTIFCHSAITVSFSIATAQYPHWFYFCWVL